MADASKPAKIAAAPVLALMLRPRCIGRVSLASMRGTLRHSRRVEK
jgi:hypothetical protein